jgi:hypothetical protein
MRKGGFEITTGYRWGDLVAQYFFLVLVCLVAMRKVIMTRIGSMDAIHIRSYTLLFLCIATTNGAYLAAYHLLLLVHPGESWVRCGLYCLAALLSYPIFGMVFSVIGVVLDGGRAIQVITARYKPGQQSGLVDLTKESGAVAQLEVRGAVAAYIVLLTLSIISVIAALVRSPAPRGG